MCTYLLAYAYTYIEGSFVSLVTYMELSIKLQSTLCRIELFGVASMQLRILVGPSTWSGPLHIRRGRHLGIVITNMYIIM